MFDFPDQNEDEQDSTAPWRRFRRGELPPIAGVRRAGPDFSGMESEPTAGMEIAAPGPQRRAAELPAIDAPAVGAPKSAAAAPESANAPTASMASPATSVTNATNVTSATPKASIAGSVADPLELDRQKHQTELSRLRSSGSGISQIHNPILRTLARVGDIAGSALFPFQTRMIPGTEFHHRQLMNDESGAIGQDLEEQKEQATTEHEREQSKKIEHDLNANPAGTPEEQVFDELVSQGKSKYEAYQTIKTIVQKEIKPGSPEEQTFNALVKQGVPHLEALKQVSGAKQESKPDTSAQEDQRYEKIVADHKLGKPVSREDQAWVESYEKRKNLGTITKFNLELPYKERAEQRALTAREERRVAEHDKAYVQPAEAVEKSYEMMDLAYQEYKQAQAQGKSLPTGAQSMVALSTHLSTTFGNVKGARITKDMIQEHLGARSISDAAEVALNKLKNGDVLSADQWEAFHDLIKQSRELTWKTAVKEAKRKKVPVDFLPDDLQGLAGHESGAGAPTADDLLKKYPPKNPPTK